MAAFILCSRCLLLKTEGRCLYQSLGRHVCLNVVVSLSQGAVHTLTHTFFFETFNNMQFLMKSIGCKCTSHSCCKHCARRCGVFVVHGTICSLSSLIAYRKSTSKHVVLTSLVRFLGSVLYRVNLDHVVVCYFYAFLSIVYNTKQKDF